MKLPNKVKVGCAIYTIRPLEPKELRDNCGLHYKDLREICIQDGLRADVAAEVLLHEILHAVIAHWGIASGWKDEEEERAVTSLSEGLCSVMLDNPNLMPTILKSLKCSKTF